MSIIALAVSIEELARELPAARRGHARADGRKRCGLDACFFAFNAGVVALVHPVDVADDVAHTQVPIVVATVGVVTALLARRRSVGRVGAVALVLLYAGFLASPP
jgi:cation:H+ antiporter